MALKKTKEKVVAEPVVEEVVEEVVNESVEEIVPVEQVGYINPFDFVYEVKAGKQVFAGMTVEEVFCMLEGAMGKVETIVIKRKSTTHHLKPKGF